jgi:galactokinase
MVGVLKCLNLNNSRQEVAVKACEIERLLGSSGGGMDQAAICLSQANKAQYIHFEPLKCESVALPHDLCIVVCNSGEQSLKIPEASTRYNKRVFELLLASLLILHHVNLLDSINPTLLLKLNLKKTQTMLHCTLPVLFFFFLT